MWLYVTSKPGEKLTFQSSSSLCFTQFTDVYILKNNLLITKFVKLDLILIFKNGALLCL